MRDNWVVLWVLFCLALAGAARADGPAGSPWPGDLEKLPRNQWAKLQIAGGGGWGNPMVYVPSRGQVLHWTAYDLLAFDAGEGKWVADYPRPEKLPRVPMGHGMAPRGVSRYGIGEMLSCGVPWPSWTIDAACYDAKRDQLIFTMRGLMAAYSPTTRKWTDLKAKTILYGQETPGGPPVYGTGTCYDPVNDEIVLFPHWSGSACPKNRDLLEATGRGSGHLGTFIFSFEDNVWRRVSAGLGNEQVRRARGKIVALMGQVSDAQDEAHLLRRRPDAGRQAQVGKSLAAAADDAGKVSVPGDGSNLPAKARGLLTAAAKSASSGRLDQTIRSGADALRALEASLDGPLRVEPPPRCATPMVYDPKNKVIVMFGGHSGRVRVDLHPPHHLGGPPGALNDTWLYDVQSRQWRELRTTRRPPPQRLPKMCYDPASGLVLLATFRRPRGRRGQAKAALWALDVAKGEWTRRLEQDWPWPVSGRSTYAAWTPNYTVGLDPKSKLLLLSQPVATKGSNAKEPAYETYALRLDVSKLPGEPAPGWRAEPPPGPQVIPSDDPAWLAKLNDLPPNRWINPKPPVAPTRRDWGSIGCDPVRGWIVYFGGGHSTYQVNDVAVYAVGANRWVFAPGDHNDFVPPTGWGGIAMGFHGGAHASHQRNTYQAIDGRMYVAIGGVLRHWVGQDKRKRDKRPGVAWFYDTDRGGVWRQVKVSGDLGPGVKEFFGHPHMADPSGKLVSVSLQVGSYYDRTTREAYFGSYDIYENRLTVRKIPGPWPNRSGECRPFCLLPDRQKIFWYEYAKGSGKDAPACRKTWLYDIKENKFTDVKPRRSPPPGPIPVAEYAAGQDAVLAIISTKGGPQQWVYSLKHNTWVELPLQGEQPIHFQRPYGQMAYVAKYGVLVNMARRTSIMRPDFSGLNWDQ